jgi:beta-lactamase class A
LADGIALTLHSLASLMISASDNTATDLLLHVVGRENVGARRGSARRRRPQPACSRP